MATRDQIIQTMTECQKTFNAIAHILSLTNPDYKAMLVRTEGVVRDLVPDSCTDNEFCIASLVNLRLMIELGKNELEKLK